MQIYRDTEIQVVALIVHRIVAVKDCVLFETLSIDGYCLVDIENQITPSVVGLIVHGIVAVLMGPYLR